MIPAKWNSTNHRYRSLVKDSISPIKMPLMNCLDVVLSPKSCVPWPGHRVLVITAEQWSATSPPPSITPRRYWTPPPRPPSPPSSPTQLSLSQRKLASEASLSTVQTSSMLSTMPCTMRLDIISSFFFVIFIGRRVKTSISGSRGVGRSSQGWGDNGDNNHWGRFMLFIIKKFLIHILHISRSI